MTKIFLWIIVINTIISWFLWYRLFSYSHAPKMTEVHEFDSRYTFINPLLECNPEYEYYNPGSIKKDIDSYINTSIQAQDIEEAAYYVRLLKNGSTFWYNQDKKFISASLVKLPLAISLMRQITPWELENKIMITDSDINTFWFNTLTDVIEIWKSYSLWALLSEMLINSDNTGATALLNYLNTYKTPQTYGWFGLWLVDFETDKTLNMSVKSYASFFRVLYNSSYLTREDSEYLLHLLSQWTFNSWIKSLLPRNVIVANKFWVRNLESWEMHIHDCWNVYYQEEPYLICVMTKWNSQNTQLEVIRNISKMIFDDISSK